MEQNDNRRSEKTRYQNGHHADQSLTSQIGGKIAYFGGVLRDAIPEGKFKEAGEYVADTMERSGKYLGEHGTEDLKNDLMDVVKKNPKNALYVGVGIGLLLGLTLSKKKA